MGIMLKENKLRPLVESISEVKRELQVRLRCYDRWVEDGKLTDVDATDRYCRLQSALTYLEAVRDGEIGAPEAVGVPTLVTSDGDKTGERKGL
jgi:hypothetical protein